MKKLIYFIIIIQLFAIGCSSIPDEENKKIKNDSTIFNLVKEHQILLTNNAEFSEHSGLNGASAFLVEYHNKVYAVTAKHLIGEAGGVEPEIEVNELNKYLKLWKMFPRVSIKTVTDTVVIRKSQLKYNLLKKDILLLEIEKGNYNIWPLQISFSLPTKSEKLYIIGCQYSEDNCKQNIYEVQFDSYDSETSMLISISNRKFEMAGFSGAPLVNSDGAVVGAVTSGWDENNKFFVGATFIKEIQNVQ